MPHNIEIAVISLVGAAKRREQMTAQFADLPLAWSFFDAHTSLENEDLSYNDAEIVSHFGRKLSAPQLGVFSSQYTVVKRFLDESTSDYLLVFEDDVIFDTSFPIEELATLCAEKEIEYIRLFGMYNAKATYLSYFYDRTIIRYQSSPCGTQAYLISKAGAKMFTDAWRKVELPVDLAFDAFWRTGLPIYSVFPFPVIERFSPSTIPILSPDPMGIRDKAMWNLNRIANKLRKIRENARLARADAKFRRSALPFRQIETQDLDRK